jgi:hypothetical protein
MSLSVNVFSQITKLNIEQPKIAEDIPRYDSLKSINYENVKQHIGQIIYLKEDNWSKEKGGYVLIKLYTKPLFDTFIGNSFLYKSVKQKDNEFNTCDYEQLKEKSFYVNKIIANNKNEFSWDKNKACLELIETMSKDIVYLFYDESFNFNYFLTLGYFEKLKKLYVGKEYIYRDFRWEGLDKKDNEGGLYNISDGIERKDIPKNTKLKCIDITIENGGDNNISAIMDNSEYGKSFTSLWEIVNPDYGNSKLQTLEAYNAEIVHNNKLIKKYGAQNAKLILDGKVSRGFTKQMCIESWGEPNEINKTTGSYGVHEQWVYKRGNYLYFENGILTTIQN